jgi:murein L,D-transpeptidase YcbB/YkuD
MDDAKLSKKLDDLDTRIERVKPNIPVYFTYSQVHFKDGNPIFSPDIYNHNNNTDFE